ncbi:MAG: nucleotidyltransferase family protein [Magnetococcales bacterium]|nr:nucleotidyltransferase family protein [Magnetococcales bacterium]
MRFNDHLEISDSSLSAWCRRWGVRRLSVFGSILRTDFSSESDIDWLVEFEEERAFGLLAMARMQQELADLCARPVDLVPREWLKPAIRDAVLASAQVIHAQ